MLLVFPASSLTDPLAIFTSSINSAAAYYSTSHGIIDLSKILDLNIYLAPQVPVKSISLAPFNSHSHSHSSPASAGTTISAHSNDITTLLIPLPILNDVKGGRFDELIRNLLWEGKIFSSTSFSRDPATEVEEMEEGADSKLSSPHLEILRSKAFLRTCDGRCWILQGVRDIYEVTEIPNDRQSRGEGAEGTEMETKLVLIGRGLDERLRDEFLKALDTMS